MSDPRSTSTHSKVCEHRDDAGVLELILQLLRAPSAAPQLPSSLRNFSEPASPSTHTEPQRALKRASCFWAMARWVDRV